MYRIRRHRKLTPNRCYTFSLKREHFDKNSTHAHCSIFARACSMVILLFRLPPFPRLATLVGSTTTILFSRGGVVGGTTSLCLPIDFSLPVLNCSTACRVLSTLRTALGVFRIKTAHSIKVVGALFGTTVSSDGRLSNDERTDGPVSVRVLDSSAKAII
jgi:hypothetical protein